MSIIDLAQANTTSEFHCDLLVVGAGVAGLVIADRFRFAGFTVDILETGGLTYEQTSHDMNDAEMAGKYHAGTKDGRFRMYGGSTSRWGAQLLTMMPSDFELKTHIPNTGWPLSSSDLSPYLHAAELLLGVDHLSYCSDLQNYLSSPVPPLSEPGLQYRFSKRAGYRYRNMARTLGKKCIDDKNTRVFLHATATNIFTDESGSSVSYVQVRAANGKAFRFHGKQVVLAAGSIEICRLLLASSSVHSNGIGNSSGHLGRWFHDHLAVNAAILCPKDREKFLNMISPWYLENTRHNLKFSTTAAWQARNKVTNISGQILFEYKSSSLFAWLSHQVHSYKFGFAPHCLRSVPLLTSSAEIFDIFYLIWMRLAARRLWCPKTANIMLRIDSEQCPTPDNRITLSRNFDVLGMPKAVIHWHWGECERRSFAAYKQLFAAQWKAWNLGELTWLVDFDESSDWEKHAIDSYHIMGGTRMSKNPNSGVVDSDLAVHGIANLSIASLSVFPTGGSANPTLTLMMLALRLADRLKSDMR
ncbi:GMC oxidoreductase [Synechococcus sp. CBW1108]|uniref:GMC oxidoreductase n=1 Tax=Synechococcus sp. CBW1108 TaxID=1353147 RepID=UPI0018CE5646|nr:GMC family oxidoreductase [Synechococcus sp. CBW1108]QPN69539.1 GMC family oxidoreductase [Synechococcus sp. CBW1108]